MSMYAIIESRQGDETGPSVYALYDNREDAAMDMDFCKVRAAHSGRNDVYQLARVEVEE
ncbi:hypothetical protein [Rhodococcus qingshengii]|uniref:hypothetical protein n=1 Tax=Rhodococcus qingshengii TaxID=334542 RepID=UPI001ADFDAE2|nr:hypothetical protein [Rhodococcus qingshengii]MCQ4150285.1 hypothetical protein [Rhodococcus qingshengii]